MAERRMFAKTIIDSDAFIDMPVTSRLLYYDLSMRADDDGFVNSPKKIMRMIGASETDLAVLVQKKFIIPFESGIVVIKHWKIHNYIQSDRYKPTAYKEEKALLEVKENKAYKLLDTGCIQDGYNVDTQVRLGKDRIGKDRIESKSRTFTPPTLEEVTAYCNERNNGIDPQHFMDYQEARGWVLSNGKKMVDWKATIRTWEQRNKKPKSDWEKELEEWVNGEK